ncbi:hypothetical protein BDV26DRAFT_298342 [Aspergillus bertholletiae]|uniref:Uncharacterized protein n=1 Tax=Aspergillus bertholletiae TaxID=1226010 RepID=A0A5N7APY3_9EURO|nr:hypothetical protein BDV26DRAFT_298342 [Aspergillus bertholletiae]
MWQNEYIDNSPEDYFDIAYNLALNYYYAVLAFLGKSSVTEPSGAQITGLDRVSLSGWGW